MVFVAQSPSILKGIQVTHQVRFDAIEKDSQYVLTRIEQINPQGNLVCDVRDGCSSNPVSDRFRIKRFGSA
ncbi:hypothetical protein DBV39_02405 [Orrella marina]|uniref:Uncharacterized protein n=1 Tax=Orrella marina TaxID=2163011 RepID=A0A2R4XG25_9BURK|nr:hypothetical protein DBV39_02405 [Orrella marina]